MKRNRFFYDCEFIEDGRTIDLISIGIVDERGREYYAVSCEFDAAKSYSPFLLEHVWPSLPQLRSNSPAGTQVLARHPRLDHVHQDVKPREQIAGEVRDFLLSGVGKPQLWARWGAYDHVVLMWLWGDMSRHPDELPFYTRDLQQRIDDMQEMLGREIELPAQTEGEHNALADARHVRDVFVAIEAAGREA